MRGSVDDNFSGLRVVFSSPATTFRLRLFSPDIRHITPCLAVAYISLYCSCPIPLLHLLHPTDIMHLWSWGERRYRRSYIVSNLISVGKIKISLSRFLCLFVIRRRWCAFTLWPHWALLSALSPMPNRTAMAHHPILLSSVQSTKTPRSQSKLVSKIFFLA